MIEHTTIAGWGDMDFNAHMRNTSFLDKSADSRMLFFSQNGFPMSEFKRLCLGPVVFKDEIEYLHEVNLLETVRVTLELAGLAPDGSRWLMRNAFYRPDGKLAARVTSGGGWMHLAERRLGAAPAALMAALNLLTRSEDFQELLSSIKK